MKPAGPTLNETERQAALDALHLIYSPAEERFDRITALAVKLFDVPYALVSLVSRDIQWFKSACGLDADQTPRSISFCGHAIHRDEIFVVTDASQHPDFADNPLVTGPPHIRFYAGQPLAYCGHHIGTLCIIGTQPRELSEGEKVSLRQLAAWVENEFTQQLPGNQQRGFLATLNESERSPLIDAGATSWNARGLELLMASQLGNATGPALFARLLPDAALSNEGDEGLYKRLAMHLRGLSSGELIVAHCGGGEWLVYQADCDRPTAELLLQRLCRGLAEDSLYPRGRVPDHWRASGVQGTPALPLDWARLYAECGPVDDALIRLQDWAGLKSA